MICAAAAAPSRRKAIGVCVGMFAAYGAILLGLLATAGTIGAPYIKGIPTPHSAPVLWWRVDENVVLLGLADVIAAFVPVAVYLKLKGRSLADLGFNRSGTLAAWLLVAAGQALLVYLDIHRRGPHAGPDLLGPYALLAAVIIGPCAAVAEETFFRGFLVDQLRRGGFGVVWQILISATFFGLAHIGYAGLDWTAMAFTAGLGIFWALVYVLAKRSLWPTIAGHVVNDAIVIPSVYYALVVMRTAH